MHGATHPKGGAVNKNLWDYRGNLDLSVDVAGYDVEAEDGGIGKIDETSTDASRRYLVVDTGFWIFGKKRLVPAGVISGVDHDNRKVYVSMTKDQIKDAPDHEGHSPRHEGYYSRHSDYYDAYGWREP
jgi:hypothetical protein